MLLVSATLAAEGMWLPKDIPAVGARLSEAGYLLPPATLADPLGDPLGAIVHVGDWCSGSFVGTDGLVLTNHHCTWGLLQYVSTPEHPRVDEGYAAGSRAEELWGGPEAKLYVVERDDDVTAEVLGKLPKKLADAERTRAIDRARAALVARCEKGHADRRCEVTAEYGGRSYRLLTQRVIRDVRLVNVPPMSIGEFGGDLDNFEWPRHDADFAVLRAYVAPDGSAAPYSPDNVPYHPPHALKLQTQGIAPGDFVAVAGFPGGTSRYELAERLRDAGETRFPERVEALLALEAILAEEAAKDPAAAAALGGQRADLANSRKYYQGVLDNLRASDVVAKRTADERKLREWIAADPARQARWGPVVAELDAETAAARATWRLDRVLLRNLAECHLLATAQNLVHLAAERKKKDLDRDEGFRDRDREDFTAALDSLDEQLWLPADRRVLEWAVGRSRALADQRPAALAALDDTPAIDRLFTTPRLTDAAYRRGLMDVSFAQLQASDDPWIQLALSLEPDMEAARERGRRAEGADSRLAPQWMDALLTFRPGSTYPDANNTLRVTFGKVVGYSPRDAVLYTPQTMFAGMLAKVRTGRYVSPPAEFLASEGRVDQSPGYSKADGDVPVNFLSDVDTTGGNSGSATLNAEGRLVGLVFDGNYESIAADWLFDPALTRSIHLDIRFLLHVLDADPKGRWVVEELLR